VLATNRADFAAAYGATIPVFDTFSGVLPTGGETLSLITTNDQVVTQVRYRAGRRGRPMLMGRASLQLIDPFQDNWRAPVTGLRPMARSRPGTTNSVAGTLPPFSTAVAQRTASRHLTASRMRPASAPLGLETLQSQHQHRFVETASGSRNTYTNLAQWPFPTNALIAPGQFRGDLR